MRLTSGTRLGPYEIVEPLGAGGMGEVYRARDSRLGREVAIKVLPEHLSQSPEILARFEREARTISSLNHPHICTLHDVGREGDVEYLVMELIAGETLAQRLERGALPLPEVLRLGVQIADALDRAHRAGIVHRDFKPGNVMLTKGGAKLTDFGLARSAGMGGTAHGSGITVAQLTNSPTVAAPLTASGTLVGTFLYMAPEQLEGKEADARSDLWALGCVLYEMATGRRAFDGKSQASLVGSIMNSEPPAPSTLSAGLPPALDALIRACLAKDPEERIQTAHDVKLQLGWLAQGTSGSGLAAPALPRRGPRREMFAWALAGLAVAAAAFLAWRGTGSRGVDDTQQLRFTIPLPRTVTNVELPRVSPDGRMIAFSAQDSSNRTVVWVRPLNSLVANPLPGTENSRRPFWSPDSRSLAFVADGKLKKIAIGGGPPIVVCDAPSGSDGSWSRDGVILFDGAAADAIMRVQADGGVAAPAMPVDSTFGVGWPAFLPDGKHYFFTKLTPRRPPEIMVAKLGEAKGKPLGVTGSRVEYSPDGYLLFARDRTLLAQRFDAGSLKLEGEPFPVAEDLPVAGNAQADFSVSCTGVLVYRATSSLRSRLAWLDRAGHELGQVSAPADFRAPALSPDGSRIAIRRADSDGLNLDIWVIDPARGTTTRFTFDPGADGSPLWSPDGTQIAWASDRGGSDGIWIKSVSGLGQDQLVSKVESSGTPTDWSRDGKTMLFQGFDANNDAGIYSLPMTGERKPQVVLQTPFREGRAHLSPDGRWMVYESDESGRSEVYVASFGGSAGKWQISTNGGGDPCWSRDGRELFYIAPNQDFMSVDVTPGPSFSSGTPRTLFRLPLVETGRRRNVYDVAPDGKRFLFLLMATDQNTPITTIVNWRAGTGRR